MSVRNNVEASQVQQPMVQPTKQDVAVAKVREFAKMDTSFFGSKITADLRVLTWSEFWGQKISAFFASVFSDVDLTALYDSKKIEAALAGFFADNMEVLANASLGNVPYQDELGTEVQKVYGAFQMLGISQAIGNIVSALSILRGYRSSLVDNYSLMLGVAEDHGLVFNGRTNSFVKSAKPEFIPSSDDCFSAFIRAKEEELGLRYNHNTGNFE